MLPCFGLVIGGSLRRSPSSSRQSESHITWAMDELWRTSLQDGSAASALGSAPSRAQGHEADGQDQHQKNGRRSPLSVLIQFPAPRDKVRKKLTHRHSVAQIGFGGCGGMYNYFLGVASVLQHEYDLEDVIFSGVSAGCFPALLLALGIDVKEFFFKANLPLIEDAASCSYIGLGKWIPLVRKSMLELLPEDAYAKADKRLYFSVTEVPAFRNHLLTSWESNEDMVDCMLCSAHVPIYTTSLTGAYRDKKFVDGGLTNNHPIVHREHPHHVFQFWKWRWVMPSWVLITTNADWAVQLFNMGREDALNNLHEVEQAFFGP